MAGSDEVEPRGTADFDKAFGARMRQVRERNGVSQGSLAANLIIMHGISWHQTTVAKVEAGERPIRLGEAVAVAEVLGVPLATLVLGDGDERRKEQLAYAFAELLHVRQGVDARLDRLGQELNRITGQPAERFNVSGNFVATVPFSDAQDEGVSAESAEPAATPER
jgi:transcriptional regulator with XRE-family HTH domain